MSNQVARLSALVIVLVSLGVAGCEEDAPRCTSTLDCEEGVCGPRDRCQTGEVGNPCEDGSNCLGTCGPNGSCQNGLAGDPCTTDQHCEYAPGGVGTFECGGAGTCERVYRCRGYVSPCSLAPSNSCGSVLGCRSGGTCGGSPGSCYSQYSSYSCNSLDGCYWSSYSSNCSGSARSCSSQYSEYSCETQGNCYWLARCEGVAYSCETFSADTCTTQPGCYVE